MPGLNLIHVNKKGPQLEDIYQTFITIILILLPSDESF